MYTSQLHSSANFALFKLVLARQPQKLALDARPAIKRNHSSRKWNLQWKHRLAALLYTADEQHRDAQTLNEQHFDACLRRTTDDVLAVDFVYTKKTSADQSHKSAPVACGPLSAVAGDPHAITLQRLDDYVGRISRSRVAKTTDPRPEPFQKTFTRYSRAVLCFSFTCSSSILALSHLDALLLNSRVRAPRPQILTRPHRCMMWNIIVPWTALNF